MRRMKREKDVKREIREGFLDVDKVDGRRLYKGMCVYTVERRCVSRSTHDGQALRTRRGAT